MNIQDEEVLPFKQAPHYGDRQTHPIYVEEEATQEIINLTENITHE